jgi:hypothetical protein
MVLRPAPSTARRSPGVFLLGTVFDYVVGIGAMWRRKYTTRTKETRMKGRFAAHMVKACREMGYKTDILSTEETPDSEEITCAVLVRGWKADPIEASLIASVAAAHTGILAGDDPSGFPEGVEGMAVPEGIVLM